MLKFNASYFFNEKRCNNFNRQFFCFSRLETNGICSHFYAIPAMQIPCVLAVWVTNCHIMCYNYFFSLARPIHLSNEMIWKLWIMAVFQSKRNKPLIAMWPPGNFKKGPRKLSNIQGGGLAEGCVCVWRGWGVGGWRLKGGEVHYVCMGG